MVLVEAIKEGEIVRITERQARDEDLFILRSISEPKNDEGQEELEGHVKKIDLIEKYRREFKKEVPRVETWRKAYYEKNNVLNLLKDNFQWGIVKARRARGMSRKQFADKIDEKEDTLKIVENGGLLDDNLILVNKIERELGIDLRKERPTESGVTLADLQKMDEKKAREEIGKAQGLHGDEESLFGSGVEISD